ncbi:MAG: SulP family inorganic anion transporter [Chitinophagaceae bacterium]|nr:SulP family inorganic anion transporter [Chitinophagaceae bacterium]MBP9102540.1 SulP family inorganic anion transporter [Chitinophagaceae bacterium]
MKIFKFTKGDFFGGLTAGIVALPLALAFGVQSGLGAAAGLYGAIFLGFFAAIFGGTPSQISGPTGPMTVVSAATIALFLSTSTDGSIESVMGAIIASFVLAGLLQILMGVFKIGSLIKFIPYPVISGFMSGIGVIIILLQLFPAIGLASPKTTIDVVQEIVPALGNINSWAILYAGLTILIIYLFPKITKAVPSTLVALLAITGLSIILDKSVPIIGDIPQGLPPIHIEGLLSIKPGFYTMILEAGVTLAALGAIDSLLTSVVADNVTKTKHNSNKELIGQGIGNTIAGIFGGLPGAGATMRTLVNIRSGGRNRISGVIHALVLVIVLFGAGKYAALIPKSVLAGILITVGIGILDYKGFKHINKVPRADAVIMIIVLLVTVFLDLLVAVALGMVLAAFMFMKKMSEIAEEKTTVTDLVDLRLEEGWSDELIPDNIEKNIVVKHLDGPLFFGFASGFTERVAKVKDIKYVIIRMEKVPFIDQTGLYALEDAILSLEQRDIEVLFTGLQTQPKVRMERINLIPGLVEKENIFKTFSDCIEWLSKKHLT